MKKLNLILLDTNIVNYIILDSPDLSNFLWILKDRKFALSFATVAELLLWQMVKNDTGDKAVFRASMEKLNEFILDCIIFESSTTIAYRAATFAFGHKKKCEKQKSKGIPSAPEPLRFNRKWHDWWIAATALEHKIELVTNNVDDFKDIKGLTVIGPDSRPPELPLIEPS